MKNHIMEKLIGESVRIVGDHPYSGCTGEIVRIGETLIGRRPVIKIDNAPKNSEYQYVWKSKDIVKIPEKKRLRNGK